MAQIAPPPYKLAMGPVAHVKGAKLRIGSQWRATFLNGWGPPCFHATAEVAIDCLEAKISEVMRP